MGREDTVAGKMKQVKGAKVITARIRGRRRIFEADALLVATGRTPNTDGLNLQAAGVAIREDKGVKVDARRDDIAWLHPREAHGLFVELRKRERYE